MIYIVYTTHVVPQGHVERVIFHHPGDAQQVMQFAQQLVGPRPAVPYQVAGLLNQRPPQPTIYCRQIRPIQIRQEGVAMPGVESTGMGASIPSELRPTRFDVQSPEAHQVVPSPLGDKYHRIPSDLIGEF